MLNIGSDNDHKPKSKWASDIVCKNIKMAAMHFHYTIETTTTKKIKKYKKIIIIIGT